ncbi:MAG: hypothetical protein GEU92_19885 [Alphaproteobacteria bacterium]|nr:hypothetical protein [Alphaproteobacteria bacterium]
MASRILTRGIAGVLLVSAAVVTPAAAESAGEFYRGKTVTLISASGAGGGYDAYARTVTKHLAKHLPGNPKFIVQFMPGAGGLTGANYLYSVAAQDGSVIGLISNAAPVYQVLKGGVKYDASKFNYIGRAASMQYVIMVWHDQGVKTLDDMKTKEVVFGATGKGQSNYMVPILLKNLLGLKARVITGYPGTKDISLALEKGEVGGRAGAWSSWQTGHAHWLRDKKVVPVAQAGLEKASDLPNAPLLLDLAKGEEERAVLELLASDAAVGRGFMMPPGVPKDRVQAMRRAFDASMTDPAFLEEAKKRKLLVEPMTGERLQAIVDKTVAAPPKVAARAKKVLEW